MGSQSAPRTKRSRISDESVNHVERVLSVAHGSSPPSEENVAVSWQRSAGAQVDPASPEPPRILTNGELTELRGPLTKLINHSRDELDLLYGIVRDVRYTVLLSNDQGVAVEHRGDRAEADEFKRWGIWLGGVWSETAEGTNAIGTSVVEKRAVSVHRSQHFRARNIGLSCSSAPIFDSDGQLAAVLDVSSFDPKLSEQAHALTGALTRASARSIEELWFRDCFRQAWVIALAPVDDDRATVLLAVDEDQRIVGADRGARTELLRNGGRIEDGISLWSIFELALLPFLHRNRGDVAATLIRIGTLEPWRCLVTPPEASSARRGDAEAERFHCRPRLGLLRHIRNADQPPQARGGLPPHTLRRVKEYISGHLEKSIEVGTLADAAGLSLFHFARAFKQSTGETPHAYILERRLERARSLLSTSDLSHSEIARSTGFSDQSHFARVFRRRLGVSPSAFRWSKR
jgi:AraC-like DNA-binding protein